MMQRFGGPASMTAFTNLRHAARCRVARVRLVPATLALLAASAVAPPALGDVCRWTDAAGKTHYSESPPPGVTCGKTLRIEPPPAQPAPAAGKDYRDLEAEFQQRRVKRKEAERQEERQKQQARQRAEACASARGRLAFLESGGRVARIDANGERRFYDEQQVLREIARQRQRVTEYCQ